MADIASTRASFETHLPYTEGGEIIIYEVGFEVLSPQIVHHAFIQFGPKSGHAQGLGLTPGKNGRAVHPGQNPGFTAYRTDLPESTPIDALFFIQDHAAHIRLYQVVQGLGCVFFRVEKPLCQIFLDLGFNSIDQPLAVLFNRRAIGFGYACHGQFGNGSGQCLVHLYRGKF